MKSNRRSGLISIFVGVVIILISIVGEYPAVSAPLNPTSLNQVFSPQADLLLSLDDGTAEDSIGWGASWEFIFLNRFTPNPSQFPFELDQIQVFFRTATGVATGDEINLVVYQDADSNPTNGATFLYSYPTTIQTLDTWNVFNIMSDPPLVIEGPGDVLVGMIALEKPGTSYFPAAIDLTTSQQRSWIGWWTTSPPNPTNFPPDDIFEVTDNNEWAGNWMIRAYGSTVETSNGNVYLPVILKDYPPIPGTPVLYPISNTNGDDSYTVSWSTAIRATSYILEEDDDPAFTSPTPQLDGNFTTWSAKDKQAGTYYYRVKAHNSWGDSSWSNIEGTTVVPPPPPQSIVYVTNDTGCEVCYEVQGSGIGRKCFSGGRNFYGSFPVGTYTWSASACCGSTGKTEYFGEGPREEKFWCTSSQPAPEKSSALQCELKLENVDPPDGTLLP